jgi:hypothetical protein
MDGLHYRRDRTDAVKITRSCARATHPSARYPQHYRRGTDARQGRTNLAEARREFAYAAGESFLLSSCLMGEALVEHTFATALRLADTVLPQDLKNSTSTGARTSRFTSCL